MDNTYYLKATGANRYAGGSVNWLKIRGFKAIKDKDHGKEVYELEVKIRDQQKFVMVAKPYGKMENLRFRDETGKPVSFITVIQHFKDRSIGLKI